MSIYSPDALAGKRILITGGGTGLGRGVAARLVAHGAEVHIWGRRENVLAEAVAEIAADRPGSAHYQAVNVRDFEAVSAAVGEIWEQHGPLTGVLNNAAANFIAPTATLSPRAFEAVTSTVMAGSFNTTLAVGKRWIDEGLPGSVLSNLTTWVWSGSAFVVPSAMAKAAVHAMTMSLAVEWGRYGIRLNALAPAPIPTEYAWEMLNPTDESSAGATQADQIPLGRTGTIICAVLICRGKSAEQALAEIRKVNKMYVQSAQQEQFLRDFEDYFRNSLQPVHKTSSNLIGTMLQHSR